MNLGYQDPSVFEVRLINKPWDVSTAKWDNLANAVNPDIISQLNFKKDTKGWFSFDVTKAISSVTNEAKHNGFMIFAKNDASNGMSGHTSMIASSECKNKKNRPKLVITYTQTTPLYAQAGTKKHSISNTIYYSFDGLFCTVSKKDVYSVNIYSINGRLCHSIKNQTFTSGRHLINKNYLKLKSGLYLIKLQNENWTRSKTIMIP